MHLAENARIYILSKIALILNMVPLFSVTNRCASTPRSRSLAHAQSIAGGTKNFYRMVQKLLVHKVLPTSRFYPLAASLRNKLTYSPRNAELKLEDSEAKIIQWRERQNDTGHKALMPGVRLVLPGVRLVLFSFIVVRVSRGTLIMTQARCHQLCRYFSWIGLTRSALMPLSMQLPDAEQRQLRRP